MRTTVREAAKRLQMREQTVRVIMQRDTEREIPKLPIGTAEKFKNRWSYYIWDSKVDKFLSEV